MPDVPVTRPDLPMPAADYDLVTGAWRQWLDSPLKAALEQAIDDAVAAERERAERAEAKLAAIAEHRNAACAALRMAETACHVSVTGKADAERYRTAREALEGILAIIDGGHAVTAAALRAYLEATGWHEKSSGPAGTLWTLGIRTDGVGVPHDDSDRGAVRAAVVRVAKREHRSAAEVTADILRGEK